MSEVVKMFENSNFIQKYVLENLIKINNYIGTPSFEVYFDRDGNSIPCDKNIILDHVKINGKHHFTCYIHIKNNVFLLYNDNPTHWVSPEINKKFTKLEFVVKQFSRFSINKRSSF